MCDGLLSALVSAPEALFSLLPLVSFLMDTPLWLVACVIRAC